MSTTSMQPSQVQDQYGNGADIIAVEPGVPGSQQTLRIL